MLSGLLPSLQSPLIPAQQFPELSSLFWFAPTTENTQACSVLLLASRAVVGPVGVVAIVAYNTIGDGVEIESLANDSTAATLVADVVVRSVRIGVVEIIVAAADGILARINGRADSQRELDAEAELAFVHVGLGDQLADQTMVGVAGGVDGDAVHPVRVVVRDQPAGVGGGADGELDEGLEPHLGLAGYVEQI
ncbi:hypothetical protein MMC19_006323 [Ptychographa xylographoides]|nr:hypothetical protein [Ptychographa xylographoides]